MRIVERSYTVGNMPIVAYDPDGMKIAVIGDKEYERQVLATMLNWAWLSKRGQIWSIGLYNAKGLSSFLTRQKFWWF